MQPLPHEMNDELNDTQSDRAEHDEILDMMRQAQGAGQSWVHVKKKIKAVFSKRKAEEANQKRLQQLSISKTEKNRRRRGK